MIITRLLSTVLVVLGFCLPVAAQRANQTERAETETITPKELRISGEMETGSALPSSRRDIFSAVNGSDLIHGLPVLALLDGRRFPRASELGRMGMTPLGIFPVGYISALETQTADRSRPYERELPDGLVDLRLKRYYTEGEIGFSYGRSTGKFGGEHMQAYIIGTVGNDKLQITAGAAYEESSLRIPRRGR